MDAEHSENIVYGRNAVLESRNGWSRIKRLDGKLGWIKSDTVEEE